MLGARSFKSNKRGCRPGQNPAVSDIGRGAEINVPGYSGKKPLSCIRHQTVALEKWR